MILSPLSLLQYPIYSKLAATISDLYYLLYLWQADEGAAPKFESVQPENPPELGFYAESQGIKVCKYNVYIIYAWAASKVIGLQQG